MLAIVIALAANAVRIAVMAVLNAAGNHDRFEYWHEGSGSNVFAICYMAAFCGLASLCLRSREPVTAAAAPAALKEGAAPPSPSL